MHPYTLASFYAGAPSPIDLHEYAHNVEKNTFRKIRTCLVKLCLFFFSFFLAWAIFKGRFLDQNWASDGKL
jgi:hypothetical protein